MMPIIDGLTVLEQARKAGINTPVLMLAAKGDAITANFGWILALFSGPFCYFSCFDW